MIECDLNIKADSKILDHPVYAVMANRHNKLSLGSRVWISILWPPSTIKKRDTTNSRLENHLINIIGDFNLKVNQLFLQHIFWDDI